MNKWNILNFHKRKFPLVLPPRTEFKSKQLKGRATNVSVTKDINNQSLLKERKSRTVTEESVQVGYIINGRSQRIEENSILILPLK